MIGENRLVTASGQPMVIGLRQIGVGALNSGWLRPGGGRLRARDVEIRSVTLEGVAPDMAIVRIDAVGHESGEIRFGQGNELDEVVQMDGELVRLSNLEPGQLYRYKVVLTDNLGRLKASSEYRFCTPSGDELEPGQVKATYYRGRNFEEPVMSRSEIIIRQPGLSDGDPLGDFDSGAGPDNFSVRWEGIVNLPREGRYLWFGAADDGQRLRFDGETLIDAWEEHDGVLSARASRLSSEGWHLLAYDFFSGQGRAEARLRVSGGDVVLTDLPARWIAHIDDDFYAPTIVARDEALQLECASPRGSDRVALQAPEVFDCFDAAVAVRSDAPARFPLGETRVVWTATNARELTARHVEFVTVVDTRPPRVAPPGSRSFEATSPLGTPVGIPEVEMTDICDAEPEVSHLLCETAEGELCRPCFTEGDEDADPSNVEGQRDRTCLCDDVPDRFPLGTTIVTALVEDSSGNCASAQYEVEITDTTPPTVDAGEPELAQCAEFRIPTVSVRDNGSPVDRIRVTCQTEEDELPGSCDRWVDLGFGDHRIEIVAVDEAGNRREDVLIVVQARDQIDTSPPSVRILSSPAGWVRVDATVVARVSDACDPEPTLSFDPEADDLDVDVDTYTATYSAESIYDITVTGSDSADNIRTATVARFGIDLSEPEAKFTSLDEFDLDDEAAWPVYFPGDEVEFNAGGRDASSDGRSGLARVDVVLRHLDGDDDWVDRVLLAHEPDLNDREPAEGPSKVKNLECDEDVPQGETAYCTGDGIDVDTLEGGRWRITVAVADVAGNVATTHRYFHVLSWPLVIERSRVRAQVILDDEDPDVVTDLLLGQIPDEADAALYAVDTPELIGNALLYTYTFADALGIAEDADHDVNDLPIYLARAAYTTITELAGDIADLVAADDTDILLAEDYLETALADIGRDLPLAVLLDLQNAWFYLQHALAPYRIDSWNSASRASDRVRDALQDYEDLEDANGPEYVTDLADSMRTVIDELLFGVALGGGRDGRTAFVRLLVILADMSDVMVKAQTSWVWVRNWQWPVSLQVREVAGLGISSAVLRMRDNPEDLQDPLLAYAQGQYDAGVDFIDERLVDDVLRLYLRERCLIFEVYNHAGFAPDAIPPERWNCPECVLDGDCEH